MTKKVCIYGATGYTGIELLRYLSYHPFVKVLSATSQSYAGKKISELFPSLPYEIELVEEPEEDYDLAFLCLPHEASLELVPKLLEKGKKVIDLSGAYRIKEEKAYPEFYGFEHRYPHILKESVYGLPEIFRESIKSARLVANPGCYPTATLLALYPFLKEGIELRDLIVDALSGVSGAGRKTAQHFHYPEMEQNFFAYSLSKHRHTPEMEDVIKRVSGKELKIRFTPKVVPASRGMLVSVYAKTEEKRLVELFQETYKGEKFVKVVKEPPMTKQVLGTNLCLLYPYYDQRTDTALIISVIDNLGKGASAQAVQNMNLIFGFEEDTSLNLPSLFP